jgi:hypothetical protein
MSELDDRLSEGRAVVTTMSPPADLWERVVEHSNDGEAAMLDLTIADRQRRPSLWLAVAAVLAVIALVGTLTLRDDHHSIETVPAHSSGDGSTKTEEPRMVAFAVPFSFDLPDDWTVAEEGQSLYRLGIGPVGGQPQTRMELAIPEEAATAEEAVADLAAKAPSLLVIGDPIHTTVGQRPATCMDVEASDDGSRVSLFHVRAQGGPAEDRGDEPPEDREVTLEEGASGRVCVMDVRGFQGESLLVVLVQAPTAEFAVFMEEAQGVLDDLEFA